MFCCRVGEIRQRRSIGLCESASAFSFSSWPWFLAYFDLGSKYLFPIDTRTICLETSVSTHVLYAQISGKTSKLPTRVLWGEIISLLPKPIRQPRSIKTKHDGNVTSSLCYWRREPRLYCSKNRKPAEAPRNRWEYLDGFVEQSQRTVCRFYFFPWGRSGD